MAIHTTEFVDGADVIWDRQTEPPDVDYKSFDAWLALGLYATPPFRTAYSAWSSAVEQLRDLLEDLPNKKTWYEAGDETERKFLKGKETMNKELQRLKDVARSELS
ncbi:hypothetical protein [Arthrobacter cupressi]|uniref:hypothetical protein n=1 Tax=Arthrobacter cupressi TaxID=1045773 RepID=UPI0011138E25|nr:hypothetical protein [Arthrobacter cupressi]NYD78396.1 hypothetical protein [Arthrobacter cupressi]